MRKIKAYAEYGFCGTDREYIMEVDDDTTDEEIDDLIWEWATSYVSTEWEEIKQKGEEND